VPVPEHRDRLCCGLLEFGHVGLEARCHPAAHLSRLALKGDEPFVYANGHCLQLTEHTVPSDLLALATRPDSSRCLDWKL
jgi:hypothetical protein